MDKNLAEEEDLIIEGFNVDRFLYFLVEYNVEDVVSKRVVDRRVVSKRIVGGSVISRRVVSKRGVSGRVVDRRVVSKIVFG